MLLGLGSILGTGVFVSISVAAGAGGPLVIVAIAVAAVVAVCNGMSSAQLAANHAVSGGTYEYGYRWLHPALGFVAGWLFLCAKSASAATAALGFAGYAMNLIGRQEASWLVGLALGVVLLITLLVLRGIRRSNTVNAVLVSVTLLALLAFVVAGLPVAWRAAPENLWQLDGSGTSAWHGLLEASALMFVAYTGYGRIATMGEEIREPRRNIPRAMIGTLAVSMVVYIAVGAVAVAAVGATSFAEVGTSRVGPLVAVARQFWPPQLSTLVAVGACTAMFGVLLNLSLGLSRVVLAMARRRDVPTRFGTLNATGTTPYAAVLLVGAIIGGTGTDWQREDDLVIQCLYRSAVLRVDQSGRPTADSRRAAVSALDLVDWTAVVRVPGVLGPARGLDDGVDRNRDRHAMVCRCVPLADSGCDLRRVGQVGLP